MQYWLMKSEPDTFGIADLERVGVEPWTGVRSMFARAQMRKMEVGDAVLFYHSNATPPGVAGLATVERTRVIDETQFDPASKYFDERATRDKPIWDCVDVRFVSRLPYFVSLPRLRRDPELAEMWLFKQGRLSVQPVAAHEYARIVELGQLEPPPEPPKVRTKRTAKPKAKPQARRPVKRRARATAKRPARATKQGRR